ncbi:glycosyltransferase family 4 protein [Backusella circina FSU 941]|nr:glycosyltransferase family 4 protein [Backusella circina FSU 941]
MRVAVVTENFLPKVDGVTRTLTRLLEHLQLTGHQVILFGPESGLATYAGAKLYGTAGIPFLPYPELKLNTWRPEFTRRLKEFDPHVIHIVDPVYLGAALLLVCRIQKMNIPIVASYHTNLATYCIQFGWGIFSGLMWAWNRYCHSKCAYTVCPSPSTMQILHQQGFQNLRIWPRGVDTQLFSPEKRSPALRSAWMTGSSTEISAEEKTILLYVGRVSFEKNLNLVLDAYKTMDHTVCHLVIVGHGPALEQIKRESQSSQLPLTFTGHLQGEDLAAAYASSDVFAFPSFTETFGQVVLESMASGLSVVGLFAEGVKDLVEDQKTGLLLDVTEDMPRNVQIDKYKALLNQLVDDSDLRIKMKKNAVAASKKYSWWDAMERMVDVYKEAVSNNTQDDITSEECTALESVIIDQLDETIGDISSTEEENDFTDSSSEGSGGLAKTKITEHELPFQHPLQQTNTIRRIQNI